MKSPLLSTLLLIGNIHFLISRKDKYVEYNFLSNEFKFKLKY